MRRARPPPAGRPCLDVGRGQRCSGLARADTSALPEVWKCLLFSVHRVLVCLQVHRSVKSVILETWCVDFVRRLGLSPVENLIKYAHGHGCSPASIEVRVSPANSRGDAQCVWREHKRNPDKYSNDSWITPPPETQVLDQIQRNRRAVPVEEKSMNYVKVILSR